MMNGNEPAYPATTSECPGGIAAELAAKDAEIERLRAGLEGLKHWTSREINARIDAILEDKG